MVAPLLIGLSGLRREFPEKWELAAGTLTLAVLVVVSAIAFGRAAPLVHRPASRPALTCASGRLLPTDIRCSRRTHSRLRRGVDNHIRDR